MEDNSGEIVDNSREAGWILWGSYSGKWLPIGNLLVFACLHHKKLKRVQRTEGRRLSQARRRIIKR